jgi:hypothetical protein
MVPLEAAAPAANVRRSQTPIESPEFNWLVLLLFGVFCAVPLVMKVAPFRRLPEAGAIKRVLAPLVALSFTVRALPKSQPVIVTAEAVSANVAWSFFRKDLFEKLSR